MSVAEKVPAPEKIDCANWPAKAIVAALAAGNFPLNRPVVGSIVGRVWSSTVTPRPETVCVSVAVLARFEAAAAGGIDLVVRADSMLDGPDWNELMSNAVTE